MLIVRRALVQSALMAGGRARLVAALVAIAAVAAIGAPAVRPWWPGRAEAQPVQSPWSDLRVEWDLGKDRRGNVLSGYVYNSRTGYYATAVQLRVTGTDRTGRVAVDTLVTVYGDVPPQGRAYFEVRIASLEPSYRVTIVSADYRTYGTGS